MRGHSLAIALALALPTACATAPAADAGFPATALATLPTDDGAYTVALRTAPSQPPPRAGAELDLYVADTQDQAVDGLQLTVVPWMPAMNHGTEVAPVVTPQGHGHYRAAPLELFMAGTWQVRIQLQKGTQESHVVPTVDVP